MAENLSSRIMGPAGAQQASDAGGRKSIDDAPLNKFHIKMTVLTFGAHFTAGYVIGSIALALSGMTQAMEVSSVWQGLIGSSALIGVFLGSILTGMVADRFGRQRIFLWSFVVIAASCALQYFAQGPASLFWLRILVGMAIGADYSVGVTLLTEVLPKASRGPLLGTLVAVWTVGYVAASFVGVYLVPSEQWNVLLATSAIPAVVVLFLRMGTPESPRWLYRHGRFEEAQAVVDKHIGPEYAVFDEGAGQEASSKGGWRLLFSKRYFKRFAFVCIFWSLNVIPYFGVYTFLPVILAEIGLEETALVDILLNVVLLGGAIIGVWLIAKFTRRAFSISTYVITAVCLMALALIPSGATTAQIVVFAVFTVVIAAQGDMTSVYPTEVIPTEVRSTGVGLATGISRLASAVGTFFLPVLISSAGLNVTLCVLGALCVLGMIVCIAWAPETKELSLSDAGAAKASLCDA